MKKLLALSWLLLAPLAFGVDQTFKDFVPAQPAASALAGTEPFPGVQSAATVKITPAQIDTYVKTLGATLGVAKGGTGATTLSGVLHGNGTSAFTAGLVALGSEISGTLPVANGGTGAVTLTGLLKGSGTSALSAAASADVISLWSGTCNASSFLRGDGACAAVTAGAPTTATYITQTPDAALSAEQALSALSTGLLKNTTTTGVLSIAALGTDYGDVVGQASSVDSEVALFSGTGGKTIKRATGTGLSLLTSGVLSALAVTDDSVALANGTTYQVKTLPDCTDTTGNHLNYTASTNSFSCGTSGSGGTPAGSNTQVQFNNSSAFGADAGFTYTAASDTLQVGESSTAGNIVGFTGTNPPGLTIKGGDGTGTSNGGDLTVQGGTSANSGGATSGSLFLNAGPVNGGTGGYVAFNTGTPTERFRILANGAWSVGSAGSNTGTSGQFLKSNGSGSPPTWATVPAGSDTQIQFNNAGALGGDADYTWDSTNNILSVGSSTTNAEILPVANAGGNGAGLTIRGGRGQASAGGGGDLTLTGGRGGTTSGAAGTLNATGGTPVDGDGGTANLRGTAGVGTNRSGGAVNATGGNATGSGSGGNVAVTAGAGGATGTAGTVTITAGAGGSTSGAGGDLSITGGAPQVSSAASGNVTVSTADTSGSGTSGTINITAGNSTSGTDGDIILKTGNSTRMTILGTGTTTLPGQLTAGRFVIGTVNATLSGIGITANATNNLGFFTNSTLRGNFDANGTFITNGGRRNATRIVTAAGSITAAVTDDFIGVNKTSGAATTVDLFTCSAGNQGQEITVKDVKADAATNNITVDPSGAELIDGASTYVINTNRGSVTAICDSTNGWQITASR